MRGSKREETSECENYSGRTKESPGGCPRRFALCTPSRLCTGSGIHIRIDHRSSTEEESRPGRVVEVTHRIGSSSSKSPTWVKAKCFLAWPITSKKSARKSQKPKRRYPGLSIILARRVTARAFEKSTDRPRFAAVLCRDFPEYEAVGSSGVLGRYLFSLLESYHRRVSVIW